MTGVGLTPSEWSTSALWGVFKVCNCVLLPYGESEDTNTDKDSCNTIEFSVSSQVYGLIMLKGGRCGASRTKTLMFLLSCVRLYQHAFFPTWISVLVDRSCRVGLSCALAARKARPSLRAGERTATLTSGHGHGAITRLQVYRKDVYIRNRSCKVP